MKALAEEWFAQSRPLFGLIWWPRSHYRRMSPGDFCEAFNELATQDEPFAGYPIVHLKPKA